MAGRGATGVWLGSTALLLAAVGPACARPQHLQAAADHYGRFWPSRLANCTTCHLPAAPGKSPVSLADFPHNVFGKRLAAAAAELSTAGRKADLDARLAAVAGEDSDADGTPNEVEILAGTRPGDSTERPTAGQLAAARRAAPQWTAFQRTYRWRPFEPVQRPPLPAVRDTAWPRNPIDRFVGAAREARGLRPRPPASPEMLLRRVYLDLTGLSPTPAEVSDFLRETAAEARAPRGRAPRPDAYERVVDRLLASPHYGERWGRHWMDVWRYSDWTGYGQQVRDSQPHIWRWRDWIVQSLNADQGYDRMLREMVAGDELAPEDPSVLPATGFLVRNYKLLSREKWMQDTVDHTAQAFLGLTMGCARCHDHMYDPITQKEYYRFRAIFTPHQVRTDWVPGEADTKKDGLPRAFDGKPDDPTYLFVRGDDRYPVKEEPLAPGVPASLGGSLRVEPVALPPLARSPERQPHVVAALRESAARQIDEARRSLQTCRTPVETELAQLRLDAAETGQAELEAVLAVEAIEDRGGRESTKWRTAATAANLAQRREARADAALKREEASRAVASAAAASPPKPAEVKRTRDALAAAEAALAKAEAELAAAPSTTYRARAAAYPAQSSGRRLGLARWLTARENPLTARVAVNQLWMRHFGRALLPTVDNFGRAGMPPTHPELLDWLAAEFMDRGWRMKELHRLLLTSSTYRMASTPEAAGLRKDPDNHYLWRMNSRRMDAEIVRDNVLWVAGRLDTRLGGPDIDQNLGLSVPRRSLYFRHAAEKEMVFLNTFDGPNVVECYMRKETIVPQQALALANSELALTQARLLARELARQYGPDPAAFVRAAYLRVLARSAAPAELSECVRFLRAQTAALPRAATAPAERDGSLPAAEPALRARENLVLVLLNHNDFVTVR